MIVCVCFFVFLFFKQKTAYEMRISDWSSDVCSSDLLRLTAGKNFADNRGNIAINLEYSKTDPLLDYDRPWTDLSPIAVTNPNDTGPNDGQPTQTYITHPRYRFHNYNGVIFRPSGSPPFFATFLSDSGGNLLPFNDDGLQGGGSHPGFYYRR